MYAETCRQTILTCANNIRTKVDFSELTNLKTDLEIDPKIYLYIYSYGVTNKYNKVYVHITYKVYVGKKTVREDKQ